MECLGEYFLLKNDRVMNGPVLWRASSMLYLHGISVVNVALNKPTWQSSTLVHFVASRAVDGDANPNMHAGGCSHTDLEVFPTWAVDLRAMTEVHYVEVMRRNEKRKGLPRKRSFRGSIVWILKLLLLCILWIKICDLKDWYDNRATFSRPNLKIFKWFAMRKYMLQFTYMIRATSHKCHRNLDCLSNRFFRLTAKKTPKLRRIEALGGIHRAGKFLSSRDWWFPPQKASIADRALSYCSDLTLSQSFQPMAAQLSKKAALPLAKILATASCRSNKTGPSIAML